MKPRMPRKGRAALPLLTLSLLGCLPPATAAPFDEEPESQSTHDKAYNRLHLLNFPRPKRFAYSESQKASAGIVESLLKPFADSSGPAATEAEGDVKSPPLKGGKDYSGGDGGGDDDGGAGDRGQEKAESVHPTAAAGAGREEQTEPDVGGGEEGAGAVLVSVPGIGLADYATLQNSAPTGLCILPLPDTDIRGTADVHAIEKEISEVECMLEALHWPKSGGYSHVPGQGCYIKGLVRSNEKMALVPALGIGSGIRVQHSFHCVYPRPGMSANYDPESDSHPIVGEGGTDYAAVPQVASAAECALRCSTSTAPPAASSICAAATYSPSDRICYLKTSPIFLFPAGGDTVLRHPTGQATCRNIDTYNVCQANKQKCCQKPKTRMGMCIPEATYDCPPGFLSSYQFEDEESDNGETGEEGETGEKGETGENGVKEEALSSVRGAQGLADDETTHLWHTSSLLADANGSGGGANNATQDGSWDLPATVTAGTCIVPVPDVDFPDVNSATTLEGLTETECMRRTISAFDSGGYSFRPNCRQNLGNVTSCCYVKDDFIPNKAAQYSPVFSSGIRVNPTPGQGCIHPLPNTNINFDFKREAQLVVHGETGTDFLRIMGISEGECAHRCLRENVFMHEGQQVRPCAAYTFHRDKSSCYLKNDPVIEVPVPAIEHGAVMSGMVRASSVRGLRGCAGDGDCPESSKCCLYDGAQVGYCVGEGLAAGEKFEKVCPSARGLT